MTIYKPDILNVLKKLLSHLSKEVISGTGMHFYNVAVSACDTKTIF